MMRSLFIYGNRKALSNLRATTGNAPPLAAKIKGVRELSSPSSCRARRRTTSVLSNGRALFFKRRQCSNRKLAGRKPPLRIFRICHLRSEHGDRLSGRVSVMPNNDWSGP